MKPSYTELPCFKLPKSPTLLGINFSSFPLETGTISSAPTTCSDEVLAPHHTDFHQAFTLSAPRCLYKKETAARLDTYTYHTLPNISSIPRHNFSWKIWNGHQDFLAAKENNLSCSSELWGVCSSFINDHQWTSMSWNVLMVRVQHAGQWKFHRSSLTTSRHLLLRISDTIHFRRAIQCTFPPANSEKITTRKNTWIIMNQCTLRFKLDSIVSCLPKNKQQIKNITGKIKMFFSWKLLAVVQFKPANMFGTQRHRHFASKSPGHFKMSQSRSLLWKRHPEAIPRPTRTDLEVFLWIFGTSLAEKGFETAWAQKKGMKTAWPMAYGGRKSKQRRNSASQLVSNLRINKYIYVYM